MDFHIIFCDILDMITVDQIHICLIISPLAAKLKAYHRSITVNAQSAQVIYTAPVIGIKTGAISHIEIHVSRCTRRNRKLIRGRIIPVGTDTDNHRSLSYALPAAWHHPPESPAGPHWWHPHNNTVRSALQYSRHVPGYCL